MNYEVVLGDMLTDYARPLFIESLLFRMVSSRLSLQDMCASPIVQMRTLRPTEATRSKVTYVEPGRGLSSLPAKQGEGSPLCQRLSNVPK